MMDNDKPIFLKRFNALCEAVGKKPISSDALELYFNILEAHSIDAVSAALGKCAVDSQVSFGITPALVLKHLGMGQAVPETVMSIQAKAKVKKCPLGIMAAAYIQPRSYVDMSSFDRNQLAAEFLELLPAMEIDIQANGYPDHELSLMVKYGVNPTEAFRPGIAGPADSEATRAQYAKLQMSARDSENHQEAYRLSHDSLSESDMAAAKLRIAKEMAAIQPKSKDKLNLEAAEIEAYRVEDLNELVREG